MRSLILTILYLAKDTLHRWGSRLSSPLARVMVVFFLSLCALCFLGSYVITGKVVKEKLHQRGVDSVYVSIYSDKPISFPSAKKIEKLLQVDSLALRPVGYARDSSGSSIPIMSYDFNRSPQIYPLLTNGEPTLLYSDKKAYSDGLRSVSIKGNSVNVHARYLPAQHPLMRLMRSRGIICSPETIKNYAVPNSMDNMSNSLSVCLSLRPDDALNVERLQELSNYLKTYTQLEQSQAPIVSALELLKYMNLILNNQGQARAIFCLGIAGIAGILLTALAGMEYRQNEYIYTLMKSFGIHPLMLVGSFIIENIILVSLSFVAAIYAFMEAQQLVLEQFFKLGHHRLSLQEIMPEIELIGASLLVCVLISSIPILCASMREIGRVLK